MTVRKAALDCLEKLQHPNCRISPLVRQVSQQLQPVDLKLFHELVYGTIRWQGQLDWVLSNFVPQRFRLQKRVQNILRLGAYQLLHLDRIPVHAAIYETVELAKPKVKTARFINAVLRNVSRQGDELSFPDPVEDPLNGISISLSYPKWLIKRWISDHDSGWTTGFCRASNLVAPLTARVNTLKISRQDLIEQLAAEGVNAQPTTISPEGIQLTGVSDLARLYTHEEGFFQVQDEAAQMVSHLALPEQTCQLQSVVDLCAAPGGKTTHLAQLMGNKGRVIAMDVSKEKIKLIEQNCQRLGVQNVETVVGSALDSEIDFLSSADVVLVDVPCSGFGTLRRHPDIRWKKKPNQISELANLQLQILCNVACQIQRGGIIVYSTCTIEVEENQKVITQFQHQYPNFIVDPAGAILPSAEQNTFTVEGYWQTFPHLHHMDGSFAARLIKT